MSTISEISVALRRLPTDERWTLLHEFADELWSEWDSQIETDLRNGHLDDFINQARMDINASKIRPLDEISRLLYSGAHSALGLLWKREDDGHREQQVHYTC